MTAYYNEIDPYCADWLRNLIAAGYLPAGVVDTRSIEDVHPSDLTGFTQCHFFAGIGGWPYALKLAGWPTHRPVWTGSCPCQPFSAAGKGKGFADERHLWPAWHYLIEQCRPPVVFGEQVASAAVGPWVDLVQADLEVLGYAFGCVPFPAAGVGAPHIRDRTYWVGYADSGAGGQGGAHVRGRSVGSHAQSRTGFGGSILSGGLADDDSAGRSSRSVAAASAGHGRPTRAEGGNDRYDEPGPTNGIWRDADWLLCRDGKFRPVEPGTFPLAHGVSSRVGRLRAYGNAIVPQQAAQFIAAFLDHEQENRT